MYPMQMLNMIRSMKNPQQFLMNAFANNPPSPMIENLINQAKQGNIKEVEQFARNFCKERGVNFEDEFSKFMGKI